jgi:hypothetical protein
MKRGRGINGRDPKKNFTSKNDVDTVNYGEGITVMHREAGECETGGVTPAGNARGRMNLPSFLLPVKK